MAVLALTRFPYRGRCVAVWHEKATVQRALRRLVHLFAARRIHLRILRAMSTLGRWMAVQPGATGGQGAAGRAAFDGGRADLSCALAAWRGGAKERRARARRVATASERRRGRAVRHVVVTWHCAATERRARACRVAAAVDAGRGRAMRRAVGTWRENVAAVVRGRVVGGRAVMRGRRRIETRCFMGWREAAARKHSLRRVVQRAAAKRTLGTR